MHDSLPENAIDPVKKELIAKPEFTMNDILEGRSNKKCYSLFFSKFAPILEKKSIWNQRLKAAKTDKDLLTISSEAFGLLILENQWDRWIDLYQKSGGDIILRKNSKLKDVESKVLPLYTRGGLGKKLNDARVGVLKGWTSRGIKRFNELYDFVVQDRNDNPSFFKAWMKETKRMETTVTKQTHHPVKSNEGGAMWTLNGDEEEGIRDSTNQQKVDIINSIVDDDDSYSEDGHSVTVAEEESPKKGDRATKESDDDEEDDEEEKGEQVEEEEEQGGSDPDEESSVVGSTAIPNTIGIGKVMNAKKKKIHNAVKSQSRVAKYGEPRCMVCCCDRR